MGYLVTGALLLVWLFLSWFVGRLLNLTGSNLWILRAILTLLGLLGAGFAFFWIHRRNQAAAGAVDDTDKTATQDVDLLVHEAVRRLRGSKLGSGASLAKLPVVFLLGESGSVKTSTIVNSGLDPELLAGHAFRDNNVLPTETANIWYTRQAIFVDCGGDLVNQQGRWPRLVRLLQPGRISSAVRKGQQAPRAAILCYSCENFLNPGSNASVAAAAKKFNALLQQVSRLLSISFPVYVLFTKLDTVKFFDEFVRNLTNEEASETLGTTLPVRPAHAGVYAEEETRRLTKAFDDLFYSLAERRLDLLSRENQADKTPGIYEFPREFLRIRGVIVDFLVNLARPSQLQANPFLRGFYFSGLRALTVDNLAVPARQAAAEASLDAGATQMFSAAQLRQQRLGPAPLTRSRRVPQWVFLTHLFNDVILKDRVAFSASRFSSRVNLLRRVALLTFATLCLVCSMGFVVSFLGNRTLEADWADAAQQVPTPRLGAGQLASVTDLQHLHRLREFVATFSQYESDGVPWRLRWGLYVGDRLYPQARQLYFTRFHQLMFGSTQNQILAWLRGLPDSPRPNDTYDKSYNALKAYLITTSHHSKSTQQFLSPVLLSYWQGDHQVDPQQAELAKQQFDFYATELQKENPFSSDNDARAITHARGYLVQFAAIERYYKPLLDEADRNASSVNFNSQFKDASDVVVNRYEVRGAFTRGGFAWVQNALGQPNRYIKGEEWVLGKGGAESLEATRLAQDLAQKYASDFLNAWSNALKSTRILGYTSARDADIKLGKLAGPSSPLLELFWFVSHNTDVDQAQIKDAFQPVQAVVQPGPADQYIQSGNKEYASALSDIQAGMKAIASSPTGLADQQATSQTQTAALKAGTTVNQIAQKFRVDPNQIYKVSQALLQEPITHAEDLIKGGPREALNQGGKGFCQQFFAVTQYYPFNTSPNAVDMPLAQFNQMFAPGSGALWTFYDAKLKQFLIKQQSHFVASNTGTVSLTPAFVNFFNRAAMLSDAVYPAGSPSPRFSYTLKQLPSNVDGLELKIGNDTLSGTGQSKTFTWTGTESVQVTAKGDILGTYSGPWAPFRFVADAHIQGAGSVLDLEWIQQSNNHPIRLPNGNFKSYNYELQVSGTNPLRPSEWGNMHCVSQVAH